LNLTLSLKVFCSLKVKLPEGTGTLELKHKFC